MMADEQDKPAGPPELSPLDRIELEARGLEQDADAKDKAITDPEPEQGIDQAQLWAQVPLQVGALLAMALPELRGVYTPEKCLAWGTGMAAVSEKYGWDAGATISRFAPEFMLIAASIPLAVPTVQAFKNKRLQAEKAAADAKARKSGEKAVAGPNNEPGEPSNPMMQEPGGFSEPT